METKPNLFIVGAAKAGTTSLHAYLSQHVDIFMSTVKEPHYFSGIQTDPGRAKLSHIVRKEKEYLRLFRKAKSEKYLGESSTSYLHHANAASKKIYEFNQASKIIIVLRDPIDRAFSHYLMDLGAGIERRAFYESIHEDFIERRLEGIGGSLFVEMGQYYTQVAAFVAVFGIEQVYVSMFDDLASDPRQEVAKILGFLGLDCQPVQDMDFANRNPLSSPRGRIAQIILRSKIAHALKWHVPENLRQMLVKLLRSPAAVRPAIDQRSRRLLTEIYREDVDRLELLLGRDLSPLKKGFM